VVHLESLFMTPYIATIRRHSSARIVLRSHNLEFVLWEKMALGARNIARKTYLNYLSRKLREYELSILSQVDGIAAISTEDSKHFVQLGVKKPVAAIPFGLPADLYTPPENNHPPLALFHIGAMDWSPNLEGIVWFLEDIWPTVHHAFPQLPLHLAGRNMPDDLLHGNYPGVIFDGEVPDARAYMHSKAVMIVPLLSAGGIRVKIIEGMASGKAIISTAVGAEGIDCIDGQHILLAESAEQWVDAVGQLIRSPKRIEELGNNARALASTAYHTREVTRRLLDFYKQLQGV
jgi:polysaccharide biosynthesis protein PslH